MPGLREYVAEAIRIDQEQDGSGILTDQELEALEAADEALFKQGHAAMSGLRLVLVELRRSLGPSARLWICGEKRRIDDYWLHCADVSIAAYDRWLDQRRQEA